MEFYTRVVTQSDENELKRFLRMYTENEPAAKFIGLSKEDKKIYNDWALQDAIPQGLSLGVFEKTSGKMCGLAINTNGDNRIEPVHEEYNKQHMSKKLQQLSRFDEHMEQAISERFRDENHLMLETIVIDPMFLRKGLAKQLHVSVEKLAAVKGYNLLIAVGNSHYSQGLLQSFNFKPIKTVLYRDYRDSDNDEAIFRDIPPPHTSAMLCYKRLFSSHL